MSLNLDNEEIDKIIQNSLIEDLGENYLDVTTDSLISNDISSVAYIKTREKCVISGMDIAKNVFQKIDPAFLLLAEGSQEDLMLKDLHCRILCTDGKDHRRFEMHKQCHKEI